MLTLDLHVHLDYSRSIQENIDHFSSMDVDGIGLCAFRDLSYVFDIQRSLPHKRIIAGQELLTESMHILALGVRELIDHNLCVGDLIEKIHGQGGLAIAAHPMFNPVKARLFLKNIQRYRFDAVEGFNGLVSPFFWANSLASSTAQRHQLPWISASDSHRSCYTGSSYIELPLSKDCAMEEIFGLVRQGRFKRKKGFYMDVRQYGRALLGVRCPVCGVRVNFRDEFALLPCFFCGKPERTNFVCGRGHYVCERCFLHIQ